MQNYYKMETSKARRIKLHVIVLYCNWLFSLQIKMNSEKLNKLQQQVRIGGKGSARRKKKIVHRSSATDDKKLQSSLKKLTVNNISGIEEVSTL